MALPLSGFPARVLPLALGAALFTVSCSSSSDGDSGGGFTGAVQNLTVDPNGQTLTVDITGANGVITSAALEASGGQMAVSVVRTGSSIAVEFDDRVTTEDQVRILGVDGLSDAWRSITTSDSRTPQVTVLSATQDTSDNVLGGDTVQVAFYGGPRVVESQVMDLNNWTVTVGGLDLSLAGSIIQFNPTTQVGELTLGSLANLHSSFSIQVDAESVAAVTVNPAAVNGIATGDSVAPSLEGGSPVTQSLDALNGGDEYGRVVEFDFDEPISPVFGAQPSNFSVVDHPQATAPTTITRATVSPLDPTIVRVHFSRPVVPGLDQVEIDGLVDAHGNPFTPQIVAIEAGTTVANSFQSVDFLTIEGLENDAVVAVLAQALDPDSADLDSRWTLTVGGGIGLVDLATQEISYDLLSKTVRFDLDFDVANGTTADLASVGGIDIDGEDFTVAAAQVTAAGDLEVPQVEELTQNRIVDEEGRTVDVSFSEALDVTTATDTNNYTFNPAIVINGAMLIDGTTVRLELADVAVPGDVTLMVAQAVSDPAGNDLGAGFGPSAIVSTDSLAPAPIVAAASAIEGIDNDTVTVLFNDMVIQSEVELPANWSFESPVGQAVDLTNATVSYDPGIRVATLQFTGPDGFALLGTDDFEVAFANIRDLGGNDVDINPIGGAILAESQRPALESAWAVSGPGDEVIMRFSEPMRDLENLYHATNNPTGVRFGHVDSVTSVESFPQLAQSLDGGLGVILTYSAAIDVAGSLNIVGLTDLAGNLLFPVLGLPIAPEQPAAPAHGNTPALLASSGVDNDTITIEFTTAMSRWRLLDPSQYTLRESISGTVIDLTGADFSFDGVNTVTVGLNGPAFGELSAATAYDLDLNQDPNDPLRSVQGVPIAAPDTAASVAVTGDVANGPTGGSLALIDPLDPNSAIIVFDETVDMLSALDASGYSFNGSTALSLTEYSARAVRATFNQPVSNVATIDIQSTAAVDSAGNMASGLLTLAVTSDVTPPTISSTVALATPGAGGDAIVLTFSEELDPAQAGNRLNYTLTSGGQTLRIATATYSSNDATTTLVPEDLEDGATILVTVDGVGDLSGNLPVAALADSAIAAGDSTAPSILSATVNLAANGSGLVVDVLFSEDVEPGFADQWYSWDTSGLADVTAAEALAPDHVQLLLDSPMSASETLTLLAGLTDPAGNEAMALTVDPTE